MGINEMKSLLRLSISIAACVAFASGAAAGEPAPVATAPGNPHDIMSGAQVIQRHGYTHVIPASSQEASENIGHVAHSNVSFVVPNVAVSAAAPSVKSAARPAAGLPPYLGWAYETPASLACLHGLAPQTSGCNPNVVTTPAQGGHGVIAIVDAYHAPTALSDLQAFSYQFGLPAPTFQVVYASGVQPGVNSGWTLESTLDIEYAHALAPNAKIILVEAASNSYGDLMKAVQVASQLVVKAGGGQVSMSWGGSEFSSQTYYDSYFTGANVVFFASSGDQPGVSYPATSPNVVAVGGVSASRDVTTLNFSHFASWSEAGAGVSVITPRPAYQSSIATTIGPMRAIPDVAALANPETGAWVYMNGSWGVVGGTSLASPIAAAITNLSGSTAASSQAELSKIYAAKAANANAFANPAAGYCGMHAAYAVATIWNFCSGVGVPANASTM
jgi:kumamolisin